MKKFTSTATVIFTVMALFIAILLSFKVARLETEIDRLREKADDLYEVSIHLENRTIRLGSSIYHLEEAMWLEGYEHTTEESIPAINNSLLLKDFRTMLLNTVAIHELESFQQCVMDGHCPGVRVAYYLHECAIVAFDKGGIDARTYFYDECAIDIYEDK